MFGYRTGLSAEQFLNPGKFAELKLITMNDYIRIVRGKVKEMVKSRPPHKRQRR